MIVPVSAAVSLTALASSAAAAPSTGVAVLGGALVAQTPQKPADAGQPTPKTASKEEIEAARKYVRENKQRIHKELLQQGTKAVPVDLEGNPMVPTDPNQPQPVAQSPQAEQAPPAPVPTVPGEALSPNVAPPQPPKNVPLSQDAKIVFESTQHDFGVVPDQKSLVCNFSFKNTGTERLVITAVNTGCGCTAAKLPKYEFAPGEGSAIEITYNPKGSGKQSRQIQVMTNDAAQPQLQLLISAQVLPDVEGRPQVVQFGEVKLGEPRTLPLTIVSRDPNVQIKSVESNGPEVVATVTDKAPMELIEPELPGRKVIEVSLKEDAAVGRVLRQLTVHTMVTKDPAKGPEPQEIKVNVFASVKGELEVQPAFLRVAPMMPEDKFEREVVVWRQGGQPFQITKAEIVNCQLPGVKVETSPFDQGDAKGYRVKVSGQAAANPGTFGGVVVLTTDLPREPKVEVRLSGVVRQQANIGNQPAAPGAPAGQPIPAARQPAGASPKSAIPIKESNKPGEAAPGTPPLPEQKAPSKP